MSKNKADMNPLNQLLLRWMLLLFAPAPQQAGADNNAALVNPSVRSNFADTAFWAAAITTKKDGTAEVELTMPENLTNWKIKVWGMGHGTKVGQGDSEVVTAKDIIVSTSSARFLCRKG